MTEQEWLSCEDPGEMLGPWVEERRKSGNWDLTKERERRLRLFEVACCRRIWNLLPDERSRQAVEVAERHADGLATDEELEAASGAASAVEKAELKRTYGDEWNLYEVVPSMAAYNVAIPVGSWGGAPRFVAPHDTVLRINAHTRTEGAAQCVLLRELFGNPFRPVTLDLSWLTPTVISLAQGIYDERAFDRLPILADALEDAGCDNADILNHCRQPGEHVRGCWVVDLVLGKK
jgi:hypothetical protein